MPKTNEYGNSTNKEDGSFGVRIRHRRMLLGLKMAELAKRSACSESMISKIENGKASPSLKALQRIAIALNTNAAALIADGEDETMIIRASERPKLTISSTRSKEGIVMEALAPHSVNRLLQANIHVVQPGATTNGTYNHEGEDLGYVLEGTLELIVDDSTYTLNEGDSFVFRSELTHGYSNPGKIITRVLWVNTPPSF
ncbi:helix-turn-helix domain-containing protein [Desulfovibrio sp. UCD-KL4C]|uniref:helix-turn-helix domain-containing protein n=1 Tax=Desulfovibrio sp. UCD-KL4C TaxID=2578120 RepID=UPI0025C2D1EA|nr:XRE family transcriptional regulator [Desulfovibrio sp. UCD-KL4C]